jgi:hypothetical protein
MKWGAKKRSLGKLSIVRRGAPSTNTGTAVVMTCEANGNYCARELLAGVGRLSRWRLGGRKAATGAVTFEGAGVVALPVVRAAT